MTDNDESSLLHHVKGLCRQIAGNLDSARKHPAMFDHLTRMVERDYGVRMTPAEREVIAFYIRRITHM